MKLTKEQINEIVAALDSGDEVLAVGLRNRLTRAFGERVNPFEKWRGHAGPAGLVPALFDAAAKVADHTNEEGDLTALISNYLAALKRIVEEIRGMA